MVSVPARDGAADVLAQAGMTRKLRERCLAADEVAAAVVTACRFQYPDVTSGPRSRTSSLSLAGTSSSSTPGTGTPLGRAWSVMKWAAVESGDVAVVPQDEVIGTRSPVVRCDTVSSRSHRSCGSAAPA